LEYAELIGLGAFVNFRDAFHAGLAWVSGGVLTILTFDGTVVVLMLSNQIKQHEKEYRNNFIGNSHPRIMGILAG